MCDCNEYEPEFQFLDENGRDVSWDGNEYEVVKVRLRDWVGMRSDVTFVLRGKP